MEGEIILDRVLSVIASGTDKERAEDIMRFYKGL